MSDPAPAMAPTTMTNRLTELFVRYRDHGDVDALAEVFDRTAPGLYRIALHLIGDPVEAEDVVQQTFLVAMEKARRFRSDAPLRPWLVGILSRRAKMAMRQRRRHPSSNGEEIGRVDGAVLDAETRGFVDEALATLAAPYREVVAAWLEGGKPPREIARDLGRAPSLVRLQLHRGLKLLRGRLPRGLAWAGAFALAAAPRGLAAIKADVLAEAAVAKAAAGSVLTIGGIVMTKKIALAATAVFLLVAALSWTFRPTEVTPSDPPTAVVAATRPERSVGEPVVETVRGEPAEDESPVRREPLAEVAPAGSDAVQGRVVAEGDAGPIAGATVSIRSSFSWPPRYAWTTQTDDEGRFLLDEMALYSSSDMVVEARGFAPRQVHYESMLADAEVRDGVFDLGDIELDTGEGIAGTVVETDGSPAAGASLFVADGFARSGVFHGAAARAAGRADQAGRFRVEHAASGPQGADVMLLAATASGLAITEVDLIRGVGVVEDVELVVMPSAGVTVSIVDEQGEPVADAEVVVEPRLEPWVRVTYVSEASGVYRGPSPIHGAWLGPHEALTRWYRAVSDRDGAVRLPGVPLSREADEVGLVGPYDLTVTCDGYEDALLEGLRFKPGDAHEVDVVLTPEHLIALRGVVVDGDDDDRPIAGAEIGFERASTAEGSNRNAAPAPRSYAGVETGRAGRFHADGFPSGSPWTVSAAKDGYFGDAVTVDRATGDEPIVLRLRRCHVIEGRVVDQHGRPVPRIQLAIDLDSVDTSGDTTWKRFGGVAVTDVVGRFRLSTPFDGEQTIKAIHLGFPPGRWAEREQSIVARAGERDVELVLIRAEPGVCDLTIDVVDAVDGSPLWLDSAWLHPSPLGSKRRAPMPRVSLGKVEIADVPVGMWTLVGHAAERGEISHELEIPRDATSHHERVLVLRHGEVRVRVELTGGHTGEVTINLSRRATQVGVGERPYLRVAPDQTFVLRALPGPLRLRLSGRHAYGEAEVDVVTGEVRELVLRGGVGGEVKTDGLSELAPGRLALFVADPSSDWRCAADFRLNDGDQGELVAASAPGPCRWRIHRQDDDAGDGDASEWPVVASGTATVTAGETTRIRVAAPSGD